MSDNIKIRVAETNKGVLATVAASLGGIPGAYEAAVSRAYNRAILEGRTVLVREATAEYTVKAKDVRETFRITKATKKNLSADLNSQGTRQLLSRFKHRPTNNTTGKARKPVKAEIKKGQAKPLSASFIWNGRILSRLGTNSQPLTQHSTVSVPQILDNPEVVRAFVEKVGASTDKRLAHEADYILTNGLNDKRRKKG